MDPVASFYFSRIKSFDGLFTIGGYDVKKYANKEDEDVVWIDLAENKEYWAMDMPNV